MLFQDWKLKKEDRRNMTRLSRIVITLGLALPTSHAIAGEKMPSFALSFFELGIHELGEQRGIFSFNPGPEHNPQEDVAA